MKEKLKAFIGRIPAMLAGSIKSFTVWFNGVIGTALVAVPLMQDTLPQLQEFLSPDRYKQLVAALVVGNLLLRIKTSKPLDQK